MIESFIYSWAWQGRTKKYSWDNIKKLARENEELTKTGHRITALSYLNKKRKEVKEDAFWAFSAARLTDMIWWANLVNTDAQILYKVHLGKPLEKITEKNNVASRTFEHGIIVLNNNDKSKTITIKLRAKFKSTKVYDLFNSSEKKIDNSNLTITVSPKSARVYYFKDFKQ